MENGRYESSDFLGACLEGYGSLRAEECERIANSLIPELEKQLREKWLRDLAAGFAASEGQYGILVLGRWG